ncbi:MAG: LexA family protein [Saprospiraceae bacterium]
MNIFQSGTLVPVLPMQRLKLRLQFYDSVSAGFPSPADDFIEQRLDLNQYLITSPSSTFFVRVEGFSMQNAGIYEGDILIVDRSRNLKNKDVIVAYIDGDFTVKRYIEHQGRHFLKPENPAYAVMEIQKDIPFQVWGVVTHVIHQPYEI